MCAGRGREPLFPSPIAQGVIAMSRRTVAHEQSPRINGPVRGHLDLHHSYRSGRPKCPSSSAK
jgi:hypothetical protein